MKRYDRNDFVFLAGLVVVAAALWAVSPLLAAAVVGLVVMLVGALDGLG